jgi:hypothetical protein
LNFTPGRSSRSSIRTSSPAAASSPAIRSACPACSGLSAFISVIRTWYGAIAPGQMIPSASWLISTHAAMVRLTPMP